MAKQISDQQLLADLRTNSDEAYAVLYREYFAMIRFFVLNNNGGEYDASDVFQDALIVIFEKSLDPDFELTSTLKTYLYSVCRHIWLKKLRQISKQNTTSLRDAESFEAVEGSIEEKELTERQLQILEKGLKKLGDPCKTLLTGFYYLKKSMEDLARELNYTNPANAKNQKYKCLQRLKKIALQA